MRDITIKNFRCYENKTMEFRRGINLLIGDNSVGKTSLLRACNLVMNSFFSGYSDENTTWKNAEPDDFREIKSMDVQTDDLPISITFHLDETDCPAIVLSDGSTKELNAKTSKNEQADRPDLVIERRSKKNSSNLVTGVLPLKEYSSAMLTQSHFMKDGEVVQQNALPIFAYFTTEDIHTTRKFGKEKNKFKKYPQKPSFGYFESWDCKGLLDCWLKRLLVLKEAKKGDVEIECVRNAVINALGSDGCGIIADIDIRSNDNNVYFLLSDGREVRSDLLSDGYRRLVSIVVDIAMRCALLNKVKFCTEAYKETHGTVIIDEIDEHLHPELQVRILKALHDTFPKIQFIVSTHAPLVMSSVETSSENVVYKLEYKDGEYSHRILNTYGLDASTIMEVYMGNNSRDLGATADFAKLFETIDKEDYVSARTMLESLKERYCDDVNPELVRAEAMLSFLEE